MKPTRHLAAAAIAVAFGPAWLPGAGGAPAEAAIPRVEKAKLALQAERTACEAGGTARISALVAIEPGWHVNSHTPTFDYLIPTVLELELPAGWPRPAVEYPPAQRKSFTFAEVPLSVYDGDVVIQALVRVPAGAARGAFPIRARLQYQACNDSQCLPPVTTLSQLTLHVGGASPTGRTAATAAVGSPPAAGPGIAAAGPGTAAADGGSGGPGPDGGTAKLGGAAPVADAAAPAPLPAHRPARLAGAGAAAAPGKRARREAGSSSPAGAPAGTAAGTATGSPAGPSAGTPPEAVPGTGELRPPAAAAAAAAPRHPPRPVNLAGMLLIAALGGLILNAMPCVLPVLSLKVFGLVRSGAHGRREMVRGALATAAGILVSFWALAALAVAAAAAGNAVGWGVQFQRPGFVAFLAVVVTLFCLNLWGLFEIPLPRALAHLGGAGSGEGLAGHFGSGLFATLMATPCSAPFLGTAVGFALTQPAPTVFAIFTAVGAGLALPYLVLAADPGVSRLLPRPGAWMETLRGVMGFLLAGSAIWLLYVLAAQVSPERLALVEVGLLVIALCTWLRHRAEVRQAESAAAGRAGGARPGASSGRAGARAAGAALAAAAVAAVALAATGAGGRATAPSLAAGSGPGGPIAWVAFDRARAETLAASGRLVFVDVTADWCFTCKVNERWVLDTPEVAAAFAAHRVLPMRADWTNRDDAITRFLADHGRYGIPFYLLYRPGREPYVFSELPSKSAILAALDAAAGPAPAARQAGKL
jgi:suppressor for copper-sensitivity B